MRGKIAILLCIILLLCSCAAPKEEKGKYSGVASSGVWISFSEINNMLSSEKGFETELENAVENCKNLKIENVYIHVRSYCDSLFKSDYFPLISKAENYSYDIFEKMTDSFQKEGIKVHAWINPYRVLTSSSDVEKLKKTSPAYIWLNDQDKANDLNVCFYKGIYLNPAETDVRKLVLDGVKEIIDNYNVDGIHIDDYFYPTQSEEFDKTSYEKYTAETKNPLNLGDWRRSNVNALISGIYSAVKNKNKDIVFSVSPAASVKRNYNEFYADIEEWIENGYVDAIIPQLYFGFDYKDDDFKFENILEEWQSLCKKNTDVALLVGLGSYKIGTRTDADGDEWIKNTDIISRQAEICHQNPAVQGYVIFSYSSLFGEQELYTKSRNNLLQFVNKTIGAKKDG